MKKPLIKRLVLKRFRSFPSAEMQFDNPLFIVGRNGAGKSNLADVFNFVSEAMSSPLQAVFDRRGGMNSVRNRSGNKSYPPNLGICLIFGESKDFNLSGGRFAFEIKAVKDYGFEIVREQCIVRTTDGTRHWYDRHENFSSSERNWLSPSLEPTSLCLPLIGGDERFAPAFKILAGMRAYSINPEKIRGMQEPDAGTELKTDGSNAASVLQKLLRNSKNIGGQINSILRAIVPAINSVYPKKHGNKLSLEFYQEWIDTLPKGCEKSKLLSFESFNISDGTLRSLGLIMAVLQNPQPSFLVIEEPEATIHPGAMSALLDLIRLASKNMQVLITTHSPELLDAKWIKNENLRIVEWTVEGASHIHKISEDAANAMKEHLMGAGELMRANALNPLDTQYIPQILQDRPTPMFKEGNDLSQPTFFEDAP